VADERSCPRGRDVDRIEAEQRDLRREVRDEYVRKDVFEARVGPIERDKASTWLSNRNAILMMASTILGVIASAYIATRGGAH
jgi:hypothetical protein